jgi:hypothetical protein
MERRPPLLKCRLAQNSIDARYRLRRIASPGAQTRVPSLFAARSSRRLEAQVIKTRRELIFPAPRSAAFVACPPANAG